MVVCLFKATLKLNQTSIVASQLVLFFHVHTTPVGSQYRKQRKQRMMHTATLDEWRLRSCIVVQACYLLLYFIDTYYLDQGHGSATTSFGENGAD